MVKVADKNELIKGLSNLAIAAGAVAAAGKVKNAKGEREKLHKFWVIELVLLSASAFLGTVVHCFTFDKKVNGILWGILYTIEFEAVRRLYVIISSLDEDKELSKFEIAVLFGLEITLYIPATLIRLSTGKNTYNFFLSYAGVVAVMIGVAFSKLEKSGAKKSLITSVLTLLSAFVAQLLIKDYGATVAHISILLALVPLEKAAESSIA